VIDAATVENWLIRMSDELRADLGLAAIPELGIVGIYTGGVRVAEQLHSKLGISFYRDDFSHIGLNPQVKTSHIPFDVEGRTIALVDDVLYSGRTTRAALNTLFDYGRPARVILCVLIEREGHELPIRADIKGQTLALEVDQQVKLNKEDLGMTIMEAGLRA
jgi:pyrimidine operon attenuation protein/uracil phosphoribosyltransferase